MVTAWERKTMLSKSNKFMNGEELPDRYSPINLSDTAFKAAKVHILTLSPGDCIYVPAYWWY